MWGFLRKNLGGDKWGYLIDEMGIFDSDHLETLIIKKNLKIESLKMDAIVKSL